VKPSEFKFYTGLKTVIAMAKKVAPPQNYFLIISEAEPSVTGRKA
jgi:hypothetical protein